MVQLGGFEPPTSGSTDRRSNHLSYSCTLVAEPESFLVTKQNHLVDDEATHAREWGVKLAAALAKAS